MIKEQLFSFPVRKVPQANIKRKGGARAQTHFRVCSVFLLAEDKLPPSHSGHARGLNMAEVVGTVFDALYYRKMVLFLNFHRVLVCFLCYSDA